MRCSRAALTVLLVLPLLLPASGQEGAGGAPGASSAWLLALQGQSPYAELQTAGLPLPPTRAEVAALSVSTRMQQQAALKAVWLERLIRAREERHRISRENISRSAIQAQQLGAPAAFVEMLRRQAADELPNRERHLLDSAMQELLSAYEVDTHELRYFVESCGLSAEQLREVAAWLPLPALFNMHAAQPLSLRELGSCYVEWLAVRRELTAAWKGVADGASADVAAEALLPTMVHHLAVMLPLLAAPDEQRAAILGAYGRFAAPVNEACARERSRLQEQGWFGSHRLQVLDYFFH